MLPLIDYELVARAVRFYATRGYAYREVPWCVSRHADRVTRPSESEPLTIKHGSLIGSGEQGFIQQMMDGTLSDGKHVCVTPCFRDEPVLDELHLPYFLKVELIAVDGYQYPEMSVMEDALAFVNSIGINYARWVMTEEGVDLMIGDIEIGSYGRRYVYADGRILNYVYGTGLALPRFTQAKNAFNK